jgi:hypothetical protein
LGESFAKNDRAHERRHGDISARAFAPFGKPQQLPHLSNRKTEFTCAADKGELSTGWSNSTLASSKQKLRR